MFQTYQKGHNMSTIIPVWNEPITPNIDPEEWEDDE